MGRKRDSRLLLQAVDVAVLEGLRSLRLRKRPLKPPKEDEVQLDMACAARILTRNGVETLENFRKPAEIGLQPF